MIRFLIAIFGMTVAGSIGTMALLLIQKISPIDKSATELLCLCCMILSLFLVPAPTLFYHAAHQTAGGSFSAKMPQYVSWAEGSLRATGRNMMKFAAASFDTNWLVVLFMFWFAGFCVAFGKYVYQAWRFSRNLQKVRILFGSLSSLLESADIKANHFSKTNLPVYQIPGIHSPFVYGLLRPAVYLPTDGRFTQKEVQYALMHEWTHIRQRHLLIKAAAQAARLIHWYNPAVKLLQRQIDDACELQCDEIATKDMNAAQRKEYAALLFSLADSEKRFSRSLLASGGSQLIRRIKALKQKNQRQGRTALGIFLLLFVLAWALYAEANMKNSLRITEKNMTMLHAALSHPYDFLPSVENTDAGVQLLPIQIALNWPIPEYKYCARVQNTGISIVAERGSPICAAADGVVLAVSSDELGLAEFSPDSGKTIVILHETEPDLSTSYQHCEAIYVHEGDSVAKGQLIGTVGASGAVSGAMCRFQLKIDGIAYDPSELFAKKYFYPNENSQGA